MKQSEIKVGKHYRAKVSNRLTTVRVDEIGWTERARPGYGRSFQFYRCTNLTTGRTVTFKSAMKFRAEVVMSADGSNLYKHKKPEGFQKSVGQKLKEKSTKSKSTNTAPHVIVKALAGTGKTTTGIEGLKILKGEKSEFTPSPQQQAIWDTIGESDKDDSVCFVAFNKSIATELQTRVPKGVDAMTMHSLGFTAVRNAFGYKQPKSYWPIVDIISEIMEMDYKEIMKRKPNLIKATEKLVSLCKMNLVGVHPHNPTQEYTPDECYDKQGWVERLSQLASHYDVDLNGDAEEVFNLVPKVLEKCKDVASLKSITFDDMIWLPVVLNLPIAKYDLLLVDECQDLNRCQQALAKKVGDRLVLFGDVNQAIYGFAGADSESMSRMAEELNNDCKYCSGMGKVYVKTARKADTQGVQPCSQCKGKRGCLTLPLTVTRRCGKAIVEEARKIVPEFEAHGDNGEGKIDRMNIENPDELKGLSYRASVRGGDMVLCRVNAPLVSECFKFIKEGQAANIQGRDVGAGLISTIKKLMKNVDITSTADIAYLSAALSDWFHNETIKENRKKQPNESRLIALQDRYDCLECFIEDQTTVEGVIKRIENIFTDDKTSPGIKLSSVHKAKGLESNRVFILLPKGAEMPHPMSKSAWQKKQEMNIKYVAITRAIKELIWVS